MRYFLLLLFVVSFPASAQDFRPQPEMASGFRSSGALTGNEYMAVTANPHASETARKVLEKGGSAVDVAIAAQLVLGLVEPQSSGLGGGAFAVFYDANARKVLSYDGRESAPSSARPDMFLGKDGAPVPFYEAILSGKSVGVPGTPHLLEKLHREHGKLPWATLFEDAIALAEQGFEVSPRLAALVAGEFQAGRVTDDFEDYFRIKGNIVRTGDRLVNKEYAKSLRQIAKGGASAFYNGDITRSVFNKIFHNGGWARFKDLQNYRVIKRDPVCGTYRSYKVCSMGEPSSGGLTILQALGLIERFPLKEWGPDARSWHVLAEASRLAFADRNHYMADPDFVKTPGVKLIAPEYLEKRSALINSDKTNPDIVPTYGQPEHGTTHLSIIDKDGNALSMTSTVESAFGSHLMAGGFFLNNEMTDFSFQPEDENGKLTANRIGPGKRPRSSMAPTIVFDSRGDVFLVIGSAGGSRIIGYVLQRIVAAIDWKMGIEEALNAKSILARGKLLEMEEGVDPVLKEALEGYGHDIKQGRQTSGLTAIFVQDGLYHGYADPRREGIAAGN